MSNTCRRTVFAWLWRRSRGQGCRSRGGSAPPAPRAPKSSSATHDGTPYFIEGTGFPSYEARIGFVTGETGTFERGPSRQAGGPRCGEGRSAHLALTMEAPHSNQIATRIRASMSIKSCHCSFFFENRMTFELVPRWRPRGNSRRDREASRDAQNRAGRPSPTMKRLDFPPPDPSQPPSPEPVLGTSSKVMRRWRSELRGARSRGTPEPPPPHVGANKLRPHDARTRPMRALLHHAPARTEGGEPRRRTSARQRAHPVERHPRLAI